jgi:DNA invertase Pin-like site-specific DNA recombinase
MHVTDHVRILEYMNTTTGTTSTIKAILYAYLRLSRDTESSASIETQRAAYLAWMDGSEFTRWLKDNDVTCDQVEVIEYIDAGVSGAKPLEARKRMRELMADVDQGVTLDRTMGPRLRMMIAWKLDRYARNVSEFLRLTAWGEARGVRIATTDNTINTATPTGRMVAVVLAALAQWEREMIKARITDGQATRRAQGRWGAGNPPYGYRIVTRDSAAYLEVDEEQAAKIRAAVAVLLTDEGSVANTAPMVDVSEAQWRRLLKAPTLRGQREHKGELIVGPDGVTPVQFAEPIIGAAEFKRIAVRLAKLSTGALKAPRAGANLCDGMSWCGVCDGRLNGGKSDRGEQLYRCKQGHVAIYARVVDERVSEEFLTRFGGFAEHVVRLEGGNDLSDQMAEAEEQAARLAKRMATAGPLMLGSLEELSAELEAAYASLRAAHDPEVREVLEPTGRTIGEAWEAEPGSRGRLLADMGLRVVLQRTGRGRVSAERLAERLDVTWAVGGEDEELVEWLTEHAG